MAGRSGSGLSGSGLSSSGLTGLLLLGAVAVGGCEQTGQGVAETAPAGATATSGAASGARAAASQTEAERLLAERSAAMQRTMLEASGSGAALGAAAGYAAFGLTGALIGSMIGGAGGAGGGSYVGHLQSEYATEERRLERVATDLDRANADAESVLEAMRAVLAEQQAEIAAIRGRIATDSNARALLTAELEDLQRNVDQMQGAIAGASQRMTDARAARGMLPEGQAVVQVDPRIGELGRRISAMRDIADTLAQGA